VKNVQWKQKLGCFLLILLLGVSWANIGWARMVQDATGANVRIPNHPKRIVALAPSIVEIIFSLNAQDRLVGATEHSTYPAEAEKIPRVGSFVKLNIEQIVALRPDLCIATKDGNPEKSVNQLRKMGIPVFVVSPQNIQQTMETIRTIGIIIDEPKAAERIVNDMKIRIARIQKKVATTKKRPRVFFQIGYTPLVAVGENTFGDEIIQLVGGTNVAKGTVSYPRYSKEQILAMAPEILLLATMENLQPALDAKKEWLKWKNIPAVRTKQVYLVESDWYNRPTYRIVDAVEEMAKRVHPELFGKAQK